MQIDMEFSESELQKRERRIKTFITEVVNSAGADGTLIGLSGGLDSTTVAHLAVQELGADSVRGLILPTEVNSSRNMADAEAIAQELGIEYDVIPIDSVIDEYIDLFPESFVDDRLKSLNEETDAFDVDEDPLLWAVACVRLRVRTVLIYFLADYENRLVLGAGHRTETLTGYFLPNGDQSVDCEPMGNLYKTQVQQLARHIGVPERIVTKPATGGLYRGQTDEEEIGLSYEKLDAILALTIDGNVPIRGATKLIDGVDREDIEHVHTLYRESGHLRQRTPVPKTDL